MSSSDGAEKQCKVYENLSANKPLQTIGFRDGFLVASIPSYTKSKHLIDGDQYSEWRTGVKHDSSKVMELERVSAGLYKNGFGETYELEDVCISSTQRIMPCQWQGSQKIYVGISKKGWTGHFRT